MRTCSLEFRRTKFIKEQNLKSQDLRFLFYLFFIWGPKSSLNNPERLCLGEKNQSAKVIFDISFKGISDKI